MKFSILSLLALILILHSGDAASQSNSLEAQRLAVAKIRVRHAKAGTQIGAAIYVGNDQQSGYFVTAYHTIDPDRGGSLQSVELQFVNSPQFVKAEIVEKFDQALDLGIIKTSISNIPSPTKQLFAKDPTPATAIRIIGHPASGDWSVWSGRVENENAPQGDSHHFIVNRDNSLAPGYSGGGIFDVEGNLLGMHLETDATYGKGLKSREILNLLAAFRVPTNNFGATQSRRDLPTVEGVDYAIADLECQSLNGGKGPALSKIAEPSYLVDGNRHLLLNRDRNPVSKVTSSDLTELVGRRLIVVHTTSDVLRLSRDRFAHLLIMRDGTVKQLVSFNYAVGHVDKDIDWKGLSPVKDHSIAIELENVGWLRNTNDGWYDWLEQKVPEGEVVRLTGDIQWRGWQRFTNAQIHTFFAVVCALRSAYPTITDMVGHTEIDNRVGDPGLIFPMEELRIKLFPQKVLKNR